MDWSSPADDHAVPGVSSSSTDEPMPDAPQVCESTARPTCTNSIHEEKEWDGMQSQLEAFLSLPDEKGVQIQLNGVPMIEQPDTHIHRGVFRPSRRDGSLNSSTSQYRISKPWAKSKRLGVNPLQQNIASYHQQQLGYQDTATSSTRLGFNNLSTEGGNSFEPGPAYSDIFDQPTLGIGAPDETLDITSQLKATRGPVTAENCVLVREPYDWTRHSSPSTVPSAYKSAQWQWQNTEYNPQCQIRLSSTAFIPSDHFAVNITEPSDNVSFSQAIVHGKGGWRAAIHRNSSCSGVNGRTCGKKNRRLLHQWEGLRLEDVRIFKIRAACCTCETDDLRPMPLCRHVHGGCDVWGSKFHMGEQAKEFVLCPTHFESQSVHQMRLEDRQEVREE